MLHIYLLPARRPNTGALIYIVYIVLFAVHTHVGRVAHTYSVYNFMDPPHDLLLGMFASELAQSNRWRPWDSNCPIIALGVWTVETW